MKKILTLFCIVLLNAVASAQQTTLRLDHISKEEGLSQSEVNAICQDSDGFIWIGTLDGLNRFDGYDITVYRKNSDIPDCISSNFIQSIFEDSFGNLWIGTFGGGINLYERERDVFRSFSSKVDTSVDDHINCIKQRLNGDVLFGSRKGLIVLEKDNAEDREFDFKSYFDFEINAIIEDNLGFIWLASWEGLHKVIFDKDKGPVIIAQFLHDPSKKSSISSNGIQTLYQDKYGVLWIGTDNGLDRLPPDTSFNYMDVEFQHIKHDEFCETCLPNKQALTIFEDSSGKLWIGTRGGGLSIYNRDSKTFTTYKSEKNNPESLSNNSVKSLFEDKTGVLWIGTLGGGVNKIDLKRKQFNIYKIVSDDESYVPSNFIRAIYEAPNGQLWIGTLDGGLFIFDRDRNSYSRFNKINGRNVFSIVEGAGKELLIGSDGGINIVGMENGSVTHHTMDYENPDSLISNSVFSIAKDDDGTYWAGTWGALHHYFPEAEGKPAHFVRYTYDVADTSSISNNIIRHVYNDPDSPDLWISTMGGGLNRLVKGGENNAIGFMRFQHEDEDPHSISSDEVNMVLRSANGAIWVATNDGLNKMLSEEGGAVTFLKYKEKDGLPCNRVQSISEDSHGNLWIATNNGLSKFDPEKVEFSNFDISDGLQSNEFSEHTCFTSKNGEIFFGGINGFNSFFPDSIRKDSVAPQAILTALSIFNRSVPIGKYTKNRVILEKSITSTDEIVLSYKDNVFTIEFSALHFASPEKNKYAYMLEGFNDNWLYTDSKNRKATFTNLKGGNYIFKVIASNNDGYWQREPTILKIKITPPIWKTWQSFILYVLIIILITYAIIKEIQSKENLKSEIALKNIEKEKADELHQMKLQFFTNISHEFRTPLTLILSPIEELISSLKRNSYLKEQLLMMKRNARYLLKLINEIMDFRKAETGFWKVSPARGNIVAFVRELTSSFEHIARHKHIVFQVYADEEEIELWFDKELMVKVLNNLIHNAFKYTPDGGQIEISVQKDRGPVNTKYRNRNVIKASEDQFKHFVSIKVTDSGIGISESSIMNVFNRFYQVESSESSNHLGSGLGLALTKSLVILSKGEIIVSSEREKGTEFIVRLPLGNSHISDLEKVKTESEQDTDKHYLQEIDDQNLDYSPDNTDMGGRTSDPDAPLILVVEDNEDMRNFIKNSLQRKFRVLEAENGDEGYKIATERIPDLIVSDVLMPVMDGIQLCRKLKKEILTSHIPFILLTALNSVSNKIEGLETGADDYISKPFNYRLFEIRVENLILSRKRLRERFSKEIDIESKDFTMNWRDQEFLDKIISIVKDKIAEPDLSVESLSMKAGMSRIHFYRKITALTDQTPSEFIRTIRLREAARLLAENRMTIAEVAYQVGFTAPSYFSTCFGKQFGLTPKEYMGHYNK